MPIIIKRKLCCGGADLKHDYTLTEEFQQNHFLVGLLLHEVKGTLNEVQDVRRFAIGTLRNLLAKHAFDNRYANKVRHRAGGGVGRGCSPVFPLDTLAFGFAVNGVFSVW